MIIRRCLMLGLSWAAFGAGAQAQVHYSCNEPVGTITTCSDSKGNMYTVMKDLTGATITDSRGHMAYVHPDLIGGTTIQNPDGSQTRSHTDALGETVYEDDKGHQTHCRRSPIALPGQTEMDCQ